MAARERGTGVSGREKWQSLPSVTCPPNPSQTVPWAGPSVQICEPVGAVLMQTTTLSPFCRRAVGLGTDLHDSS